MQPLLRLVLLTATLTPSAASQSTYTVMGPGYAWGISANGEHVVGSAPFPDGSFLWSASTGQRLIGDGSAKRVSNDGNIVMGGINSLGNDIAARWTPLGGWESLGFPASGPTPAETIAWDMTPDGGTIVGEMILQSGSSRPFIWTLAMGMVELPLETPWGRASSISADGSVICGLDGDRMAYWEWPSGMETRLPVRNGAAPVVDSTGTWMAISSSSSNQEVVKTWSDAEGAGAFPAATVDCIFIRGENARTTAVATGGERIVGWRTVVCMTPGQSWQSYKTFPTVWTPSLGHIDLVTALYATGMPASSISLHGIVSHMTPDGSIIVGTGGASSGWFMATLDESIGSNYCGPAAVNSTGGSATIRADGLRDIASNAVRLTTEGLPPYTYGFFLNGTMQGNSQLGGMSQGTLCLSGSIGRHDADLRLSGSAGTFHLRLDLTSIPTVTGPATVLAGETWNFQSWFRDANPGQTSNTSNAVSITF